MRRGGRSCATQPDTPFDAGKTVGIGVAWIVTIWFIIRQALQVAREFGAVLRECGGLTRLARDPAGFADDAGRLFGPGHKPATPEQRARIKDGVDRVGQPGAKPAPARRPGSVAPTAGTWREAQAIVEEGKFGYIFGRATGDPHGAARSTGLLAEMRRLGIRDDATGREILREHFRAVIADDSSVSLTVLRRHGTFERRESLLAGPSGKFALVESDWQVMPGGARRFVTMVVKRGQR